MELNHEYYMKEALKLAKEAYDNNEVPIGAIIVHNGEIIGRGCNKRNTFKNPLMHAEIIAIDEAAAYLGDWRIEECTMYVTVEPCPMCSGAIVQSRIPELVFGARNKKAGCAGSVLNLLQQPGLNHRVNITEGVLEEECSSIMTEFFKRFRKNNA
jgi:tRNA(adenine34) deaminase